MLQHQHQDSEGDPGDTVVLTDRAISTFAPTGTVVSGVKVDSDGTLYQQQHNGNWSAIGGEWLMRGSAAGFWVSRTLNSGTLTTDAGAGPLQLSTDRIYGIEQVGGGTNEATITLSISSDASGVPVVATAQFVLIAQVGLTL